MEIKAYKECTIYLTDCGIEGDNYVTELRYDHVVYRSLCPKHHGISVRVAIDKETLEKLTNDTGLKLFEPLHG